MLWQAWQKKLEIVTPEAQEKAALVKMLEDIGIARFHGRYISGVLSNDSLAQEFMCVHFRKAERRGPIVTALKIVFG